MEKNFGNRYPCHKTGHRIVNRQGKRKQAKEKKKVRAKKKMNRTKEGGTEVSSERETGRARETDHNQGLFLGLFYHFLRERRDEWREMRPASNTKSQPHCKGEE